MLRIDKFTATRLLKMNLRTENHGDGLANAFDLECEMEAPNTFLEQLAPELLDMLFMPLEEPSEQQAIEGVPETKPLLRSHSIKYPMDLEGDYAGYQITVDRGLGGSSNLVLQEAKLNKVRLTCIEGGSIKIRYRLQVSNVGEDVIGKLAAYQKRDMHLALLPPQHKPEAINGTQAAFEQDHPGAKAANAEPQKQAAEVFAENEAAGKNKPASEVPAPKKKRGGKPSLKVVEGAAA